MRTTRTARGQLAVALLLVAAMTPIGRAAEPGTEQPRVLYCNVGYRIHYMQQMDTKYREDVLPLPPHIGGPSGINCQWYFPHRGGAANFNLDVWENW